MVKRVVLWHTQSRLRFPPMFAHMYTYMDLKRLGCHAGRQEVSRYHTKGKSEERINPIVQRDTKIHWQKEQQCVAITKPVHPFPTYVIVSLPVMFSVTLTITDTVSYLGPYGNLFHEQLQFYWFKCFWNLQWLFWLICEMDIAMNWQVTYNQVISQDVATICIVNYILFQNLHMKENI